MKRTACILIIIALLCGAYASADLHLDIQVTPAVNSGAALTFDVYEQEGAVYAVSSLFPDYVTMDGLQECLSVTDFTAMLSIGSGLAAKADRTLTPLFTQWLEKRLSEPRYGDWAGELFESASSVRTATFSLDELIAMFETNGTQATETSRLVESLARRMMNGLKDSGLTVSVSSFDEGKYLTASVYRREDVIMTVSADYTMDGARRVLAGFRENGRYYYRDTVFRYEEESCSATSMFYSGGASSSLSAEGASLLFTETFIAKNEPDWRISFESTLSSPALENPLVVTGSAAAGEDGCAQVEASACIGGPSNEVLRISASVETLARQVAFTDKETVTADNKNGSNGIMLSAASGLMLFAAELIPALPETYRNLLWNLPLQ